tara:strand:+ start:29648 stop:30448 length:801 start_codon:yes stop_codon:yes gene_type:complete
MSLALAHKRKVITEREKQQKLEQSSEIAVGLSKLLTESQTVKGIVPAELQKLEKQLSSDLETLKILKGDQQRDPLKAEMIEKYRPLCEWYIENFEDWGHLQSLAWWLVWQYDLVAFEEIEPLLYQGVVHGLTQPKIFKASWQSWYCDVVKDHYSEQLKTEQKPDATVINKVITDITNGEIVLNAPLKAKLFALFGKLAVLNNDHKTAVRAFEKALSFDEAVGVKKMLKDCNTMLATQLSEDESETLPVDAEIDEEKQTEAGESHGA